MAAPHLYYLAPGYTLTSFLITVCLVYSASATRTSLHFPEHMPILAPGPLHMLFWASITGEFSLTMLPNSPHPPLCPSPCFIFLYDAQHHPIYHVFTCWLVCLLSFVYEFKNDDFFSCCTPKCLYSRSLEVLTDRVNKQHEVGTVIPFPFRR